MITAWQKVWREGVAPQLSDNTLAVLRQALEMDDKRLLQARKNFIASWQRWVTIGFR